MPLEAPTLDVRTFDQLLREAQLRIPRYAPEWTDFNDSDPGMTLVQLFAWLTEMMLYQMNRVPERNYIKFLQLLNFELRAAQPARGHVTFTPRPGAAPRSILRRSQLGAQSPDGELLVFETEDGLDLIRLPLSDVQVSDGSNFTVCTSMNEHPGATYRPFGWVPQVGSALYLGFAQSDPPAVAPIFPRELRLRVNLPSAGPDTDVLRCGGVAPRPKPPVTLVWEYKERKPANDVIRWRRLNVFDDQTIAFSREGYVLLEGPTAIIPTIEGNVDEERFWLRCRLMAGSYPAGREPVIDFIRPNTVAAVNLATVRGEILGVSEGVPEQFFSLRYKPVVGESLVLRVGPPGDDGEDWTRADDFLASRPDDPHFILNPTTGEVRFGDGRRGRVPPATYEIVAWEYRYGGGTAGNTPAGSIITPLTALEGVDSLTNERPAVGGRDEQDVEELKERAPHMLRCRGRAVTAEDFKALAQDAGGVAKATAIALAHPDHPGVEVPGAVTVVIVPDSDAIPPSPSPELLESVCRSLDGARLLTSEVYVKGPSYKKIKVEARVTVQPYAAFDAVAQDVGDALDTYLHPLGNSPASRRAGDDEPSSPPADHATPSGPDAAQKKLPGWNFGQELFPGNLFAVILNASPDVVAVLSLAVSVDGVPHDNLKDPVRVLPDGLLYGQGHDIKVEPAEDL